MQFCKLHRKDCDMSHMKSDNSDNYDGLIKGESEHEFPPY